MRQSENKYLRGISRKVGESDHQKAIALLLNGYRGADGTLEAIASRLDVWEILVESLPFDGGIFETPNGGRVIKLNSHSSRARRRFTLAHEIGHLLVERTSSSRKQIGCTSDTHLEQACNMVAAELLMPAEQVASTAAELGDSSPGNLRRLASRFEVSLYAAAVRVHKDLKLWTRSIGLWRWDSGPQELWFVGERPWQTLRPGFAAFESARESDRTIQAIDSFRRGESTKPVSLELLNLGSNLILGLIGTTWLRLIA